jgi:chromosome partitioning protein
VSRAVGWPEMSTDESLGSQPTGWPGGLAEVVRISLEPTPPTDAALVAPDDGTEGSPAAPTAPMKPAPHPGESQAEGVGGTELPKGIDATADEAARRGEGGDATQPVDAGSDLVPPLERTDDSNPPVETAPIAGPTDEAGGSSATVSEPSASDRASDGAPAVHPPDSSDDTIEASSNFPESADDRSTTAVSRETESSGPEQEGFLESPPPVDDHPLETPFHAGIHPQEAVDEPGVKLAPTPTDILFGPRPTSIGMGAMTASQIAARATSDALQRRLLETPIAAATERTLLVNEGRTMGREFPLPAQTRVFVVANQKGGVGKTTTTVNVAAGLALYGARILIIDLDPQGNASTALGVDHSEGTPGVYEAIIEGEPLSKLIAPCAEHPGIFVVPATIDLAGAEIELVSIVAREGRLKKALDTHLAETEAAGEKYDYVFIDCPPSLGLLTVNALTAAREVLVPIQSEYYALEGLSQLLRHIEMVKSHLNPDLDVSTILLTMYDARTKLAGEVAAEVRGHFQDAVLRTAIPRSVRISEAPSHGQTVLAYDPASAGALSYLEASREIAMRNNA